MSVEEITQLHFCCIINIQTMCTVIILTLTHIHLEMYWCILSTVATDGLVVKQQAISIHSAH